MARDDTMTVKEVNELLGFIEEFFREFPQGTLKSEFKNDDDYLFLEVSKSNCHKEYRNGIFIYTNGDDMDLDEARQNLAEIKKEIETIFN